MFWACLFAFIFHYNLIDPQQISPEEIAYIEAFPFQEYQVYHVNGSGDFYLDSNKDTIKDFLKENLTWEATTAKLIRKHVKKDSIAIDLGAHIGTHTLVMAEAVGPKGKVLAFEPQSKIFRELVMNLTLNKCHNVLARHCAIGETHTTVYLDPVLTDNEGARTIGSKEPENRPELFTGIGSREEAVSLCPLDSFSLNNVSFIKIDVENYEDHVLEGAKQTILRNKPILLVEIMGHKVQAAAKNFDIKKRKRATIQKIERLGYRVKHISDDDYLAIPIKTP